ncbi:MAG: hypothetical protein ACRDTH_20790 [Pseudonocardiaceae bacterium]
MSGIPKYATVELARAAKQRQEEERRRRAEERQRRAEERHRQRMAERAARIGHRRGLAAGRVQELTQQLGELSGIDPGDQRELRRRLADLNERLTANGDALGVDTATADLMAVEHYLSAVLARSADAAADANRVAALTTLTASLDAEPDRLKLDAQGARCVDGLLRSARDMVHDARRFRSVHAELTKQARQHLENVESRRSTLTAVTEQATEALDAFDAVLAEANELGVELPGQDRAEATRERLLADLSASLAKPAATGAAALTRAVEGLEASLEEWLDRLYRTRVIVEAAAEALPKVGFQIREETFTTTGSDASFQVVRADGSVMGVSIESIEGTDDGVRLVYNGRAADFTVEKTADGPVAVCERTEELLERLHSELGVQDIEVGQLWWEGKPGRPPRRAEQIHREHTAQPRHRG